MNGCQICFASAGHHLQCPNFVHASQYRPPRTPAQMQAAWQAPRPQYPAPAQYTYAKRQQSVKVHLMLLLFTAGIGNVFYAMWANSKTAARYKF